MVFLSFNPELTAYFTEYDISPYILTPAFSSVDDWWTLNFLLLRLDSFTVPEPNWLSLTRTHLDS